jgi:hypothetical protein
VHRDVAVFFVFQSSIDNHGRTSSFLGCRVVEELLLEEVAETR